MKTGLIIGIVLFFILFGIVIYGLLVKPSPTRIKITAGSGTFNKQCISEKISCNTDQDCLEQCAEVQQGEEMVCQAIPPISSLSEKQKQIMNSTANSPSKYCVPAKALDTLKTCNYAHGGIPIFSGWSGDVNRMEFDCLCSYPEWANSRICDARTGICTSNCEINPDICRGGTLHWDLTKNVQSPIAQLCECKKGDVLVIDNSDLPRCVPEGIQNYYDDLDISTGIQGGQQLINVDGIPFIGLNKTQVCQSCQCCVEKDRNNCKCTDCENKYTPCANGCCFSEDGVCCGDYCCPKNYKCDTENGRCIREKCCPQADGSCTSGCCNNETTCDNGCCPLSGGICCPGGNTCCPKNFPICDMENKTCNPKITKMISGSKCETGDDNTQCLNGCCPFTDGICCGDYCCPSEYPICDIANGACKQKV